MNLRAWFRYERYLHGLARHGLIFLIYTGLFLGGWFLIRNQYTGNWLGEPDYLSQQGLLSRVWLLFSLCHLALIIWLRPTQTRNMLRNWWAEPAHPITLALFRIVFMLTAFGALQNWALTELIHWTDLPDSAREGLPGWEWIVHSLPINSNLYRILASAAAIAALMAALGLFTRISLWIYVALAFYVWGVPWMFGKLNHVHIYLWFPLILALAPSGEFYSLDRLIRKKILRRKLPELHRSSRFGQPLKAVMLILAVIYFFSGFHKVWDSGFEWALGESMLNQIHHEWFEHYHWRPDWRPDQTPWLIHLGGLLSILWELLFPLLLFSPITRLFALIGGLSLHNSAGYLLRISFSGLQRAYLVFVEWDRIGNFIRRLLRRKKEEKSIPVLESTESSSALKWVLIGLLGANAVCGLFAIHTWPVSSFPSYSRLVPGEINTLEVKYFIRGEFIGPVDDWYQYRNFSKEGIRPLEEAILAEGIPAVDETKLRNYLGRQAALVPLFGIADSLEIWLWRSDLSPEHAKIPLETTLLFTENRPFNSPSLQQQFRLDEPEFFFQGKLANSTRMASFRQQFVHPPSGAQDACDFFGRPGFASNTSWMSLIALVNVKVEGYHWPWSVYGAMDEVKDFAPSYDWEGQKDRGFDDYKGTLTALKIWATEHPDEVRKVEEAYENACRTAE